LDLIRVIESFFRVYRWVSHEDLAPTRDLGPTEQAAVSVRGDAGPAVAGAFTESRPVPAITAV
jgi:hypothetical protein